MHVNIPDMASKHQQGSDLVDSFQFIIYYKTIFIKLTFIYMTLLPDTDQMPPKKAYK